jgi:hypothetical protein
MKPSTFQVFASYSFQKQQSDNPDMLYDTYDKKISPSMVAKLRYSPWLNKCSTFSIPE